MTDRRRVFPPLLGGAGREGEPDHKLHSVLDRIFGLNKVTTMKQAVLPAMIRLLLAFASVGYAAEANGNTNAPTGRYASISDLPEQFVVQFNTNGTYKVQTTGLRTNSQSGVWRWDDKKLQFQLTPTTNSTRFEYEFRQLRVDPRQPDTLQWIPVHNIGASGGALDYVRLKRKD